MSKSKRLFSRDGFPKGCRGLLNIFIYPKPQVDHFKLFLKKKNNFIFGSKLVQTGPETTVISDIPMQCSKVQSSEGDCSAVQLSAVQ